MHGDAAFSDGIFDNLEGPLLMMCSCIVRKEALSGWCDVGTLNV